LARISLWVKPGAKENALKWDPWRKRWAVACRAAPTGGQANRAVLELVAEWLEVPRASVRWKIAGSARTKELEVDELTDREAVDRMRRSSTRAGSRNPSLGT